MNDATPRALQGAAMVACTVLLLWWEPWQGAEPRSATQPADVFAIQTYPKANWRLAPYRLGDTLVFASHIVVTHARSHGGHILASRAMMEDPARRARSPEAARARILTLRQALEEDPGAFEQLAHTSSDHSATARLGGALGPSRPTTLPPAYLDVIAALRPGEISAPIETPLGFHIIRREAVPTGEPLAAKHIVIAHTRSAFPSLRDDRPLPDRSYAEALAQAQHTAERLRASPARFEELALSLSDDVDALRGGAMGSFSMWAPGDPRIAQAVSAARLGEVVGPVETEIGFQVLMRVAPRQAQAVAANIRSFTFWDDAPPDSDVSRGQVSADAAQELAALMDGSEGWAADELSAPMRWELDAAPVGVADLLRTVAPGELVPELVQSGHQLFILRRAEAVPAGTPPTAPKGLPTADRVDIKALVAHTTGASLTEATLRLAEATRALTVLGVRVERTSAALERFATELEGAVGQERVLVVERLFQELERELGPTAFDTFVGFAERWVELELMRAA